MMWKGPAWLAGYQRLLLHLLAALLLASFPGPVSCNYGAPLKAAHGLSAWRQDRLAGRSFAAHRGVVAAGLEQSAHSQLRSLQGRKLLHIPNLYPEDKDILEMLQTR